MSDELDRDLRAAATENLKRMGIRQRSTEVRPSNLVAHRCTAHVCRRNEYEAEIERLRAALERAAAYLNTAGNTYPGSSFQTWCNECAGAVRRAGEAAPADETSGGT